MIVLHYKSGKILVEGGKVYLNDLHLKNEFPAQKYDEIKEYLEGIGAEYIDEVDKIQNIVNIKSNIILRGYQKEALENWKSNPKGVVVLPTGAGKTVLALKAVEEMQVSTLIIVPTLVLLEQWRREINQAFKIESGVIGGGQEKILPITVSTYDSAYLRTRKLGNRFQFLIFDEVHHVVAPSYSKIATRYIAPLRLGLTATLPRNEVQAKALEELVGDVVYRLGVDDLAGTHLAEFSVRTIKLPLSPPESIEYNRLYDIYRNFLSKRNIKIRSTRDYVNFVQRSGRDPEARRALLSRNRAMDIAMNSSTKINYLKKLLASNPEEKILIFTRQNKLVYKLSKELLIPAITHQTPQSERDEILRYFLQGKYVRIITSRVLDEGVDVPDASIAVILSGSGSNRQFIQRLGRILRPKPGKQAILFELVSLNTAETRISQRRRQS
jgi:superfamily II DNA or RNA helicase